VVSGPEERRREERGGEVDVGERGRRREVVRRSDKGEGRRSCDVEAGKTKTGVPGGGSMPEGAEKKTTPQELHERVREGKALRQPTQSQWDAAARTDANGAAQAGSWMR
jgi:hypothetical protein